MKNLIITKCRPEDVDTHYSYIAPLVSDNGEIEFKSRMLESVDTGTAFCVKDSGCFLYYLPKTAVIVDGVAIHGHENPAVTISMLCAIFNNSTVVQVNFYPHEGADLISFKTLLGGRKSNGCYMVDVGRIMKIVKNKTLLEVPDVISS